MKLYTSYFGQLRNLSKRGIIPVSVARYNPKFFKGYAMYEVAPYGPMLKMEEGEYRRAYASILRRNDANKIYQLIQRIGKGSDVALLCYEKPGEFCHRRLLAEWLEKSLGIEVPEFVVEESKAPQAKQLELF